MGQHKADFHVHRFLGYDFLHILALVFNIYVINRVPVVKQIVYDMITQCHPIVFLMPPQSLGNFSWHRCGHAGLCLKCSDRSQRAAIGPHCGSNGFDADGMCSLYMWLCLGCVYLESVST